MSTCPRCHETVPGRQSKRPCPTCREELGLPDQPRRRNRSPYAPGTHDQVRPSPSPDRPTPEAIRARLLAALAPGARQDAQDRVGRVVGALMGNRATTQPARPPRACGEAEEGR